MIDGLVRYLDGICDRTDRYCDIEVTFSYLNGMISGGPVFTGIRCPHGKECGLDDPALCSLVLDADWTEYTT